MLGAVVRLYGTLREAVAAKANFMPHVVVIDCILYASILCTGIYL